MRVQLIVRQNLLFFLSLSVPKITPVISKKNFIGLLRNINAFFLFAVKVL